MANSRLRDFYDIWILATEFEFKGTALARAIKATFKRRKTELPNAEPIALTSSFSEDPMKLAQWRSFLGKGRFRIVEENLGRVVEVISSFVTPPTRALIREIAFDRSWKAGGPWRNR